MAARAAVACCLWGVAARAVVACCLCAAVASVPRSLVEGVVALRAACTEVAVGAVVRAAPTGLVITLVWAARAWVAGAACGARCRELSRGLSRGAAITDGIKTIAAKIRQISFILFAIIP